MKVATLLVPMGNCFTCASPLASTSHLTYTVMQETPGSAGGGRGYELLPLHYFRTRLGTQQTRWPVVMETGKQKLAHGPGGGGGGGGPGG